MDSTATPTDTVVQPLWDAPVRLLHALMALSVGGAWLTAETEGLRALHISFGLTLALAMGVRLVWGFVGTPPARFVNFVRGPAAVAAHLRKLRAGLARPEAGHNPAGGWAVLALLAAGLLAAGSGWMAYRGGEAWEELHEAFANGLLALVGLHVAAVLLTGLLTRDRLVSAMLSGRKSVPAGTPPTRAMHRGLALAVLLAALGLWAWSMGPASPWQGTGWSMRAEDHGPRHHHHRDHDKDDD